MSRPMRIALEQGVIRESDDVFDYGCGHGTDVDFLAELGYAASGWDPHHRPNAPINNASVVNLGFVLNVIEKPGERVDTLKQAYALCARAVVVSVRISHEAKFLANTISHSDGVLTSTDTFQRFFTQAEARSLIDQTLQTDCTPLAPGVFVAFRDETAEQEWLDERSIASRRIQRLRRVTPPRKSIRDKAYEAHPEIFGPLEEFIADRGRLPAPGEVLWEQLVVDQFGSYNKAFQVIRHVASEPWWEAAADDRREELLIRFALQRIRRIPKFASLPVDLRTDIKELFGSYKRAVEQAERLLFAMGSPEVIKAAVSSSRVGKRTPDAFYVHVDCVDRLPALLRVFVGAGETLVGNIQGATLVKIHIEKPRVSWLMYPEFDTDPHPPLTESWVVDFRELDVRPYDYRDRSNPPILHRKELFIGDDDPRHSAFKRLSDQEVKHGLLDESHLIGTRAQWESRLAERGWRFRGRRLVRRSPGPPG